VYLDGVRQLAGTDFTASGTVLTFTTAPANGVGVDVYFLGLELSIPTPADATVTAAKLASNAVTSVKIIDDAVTLAKMASGTDGNIISYDASGNPVAIATGSDGQVLTSAGAGAPPAFEAAGGLTQGTAVASTSGTAIDYTGLPSGIKSIRVSFSGVSTGGNGQYQVQIGDSGGFETSGYLGASGYQGNTDQGTQLLTSGFVMQTGDNASVFTGIMHLTLVDGSTNTWVSSGMFGSTATAYLRFGAYGKSLSGELTQVRLTSVGADTFDAGKVNIQYE
jgi:hypothetical protein